MTLTKDDKALIQIALTAMIAVYTQRALETRFDRFRATMKRQVERLETVKRKVEKL